jgi:crotonobetainyl-CoA:carnitine CoA-transferase CaiB-like acyl-CoA transferase
MIDHPQVAANELLQITEHPQAGTLRQARPPARFSRTPSEIRSGAPRLGEHTEDLLAELGVSAEQRETLRRDGVIGAL